MAIQYEPRLGTLVRCDFRGGFKPPEMVKPRPCVVLSRRGLERGRLCTVVPLSTTPPDPVHPYHHKLVTTQLPAALSGGDVWAKCDMLFTASWDRLNLIQTGRDLATGKRTYWNNVISGEDLRAIKCCILHTLALESLNEHVR